MGTLSKELAKFLLKQAGGKKVSKAKMDQMLRESVRKHTNAARGQAAVGNQHNAKASKDAAAKASKAMSKPHIPARGASPSDKELRAGMRYRAKESKAAAARGHHFSSRSDIQKGRAIARKLSKPHIPAAKAKNIPHRQRVTRKLSSTRAPRRK